MRAPAARTPDARVATTTERIVSQLVIALTLTLALPARASQPLDRLLACRTIASSAARLACFDRQSAEYRESVLPSSCRKRVAMEAGVTTFWSKYVGLDGKVVGIDRFGLSAPAAQVFKALGITTEALVAAARSF